ncbi:MAG: soluble lytic murein transglycosylase-like protein [Bacteriovoracaceae bacterium]|jgi:soluble lytic murein transglycosylase-like protein
MTSKFIGFLALFIFNSALASDPGFRVPHRFFEPDAMLFEQALSEEVLTKYISKMASSRSEELISNKRLAKEIIHTSACFGIDPHVLTGLIHTESFFNNNATSNTGAVGFTQFTNIGVREVHDQLGERGKHGAIASTIKFWRIIFTDCIDPEWVPLWKRTLHLNEEERKAYQKKIIKRDPALSLAYGALLLKLYWGRQSQLWEERDDVTKEELFLRALARYNGEPDGRAEAYAIKVMKRANALFNFNP